MLASLWSIEDETANAGYRNLKAGEFAEERRMRDSLDEMWAAFEPFADRDFIPAFARDPDARFWELFIGFSLLQSGQQLLTSEDRGRRRGLPDICVMQGDRRIWIEAIAPSEGDCGPDQVIRPIPINEGGRLIAAPERQVQLRVTSALFTKAAAFSRYEERGIVGPNDVRLVAIGASRFGAYASDDPPSALRAVFPIGDQFARLDLANEEIVEEGHLTSWHIDRQNGQIDRTAFLTEEYRHISGIVWARSSIGNFNRAGRPISLIHNPMSAIPMPAGWTAWDREYIATRDQDTWVVQDNRAEEND